VLTGNSAKTELTCSSERSDSIALIPSPVAGYDVWQPPIVFWHSLSPPLPTVGPVERAATSRRTEMWPCRMRFWVCEPGTQMDRQCARHENNDCDPHTLCRSCDVNSCVRVCVCVCVCVWGGLPESKRRQWLASACRKRDCKSGCFRRWSRPCRGRTRLCRWRSRRQQRLAQSASV
jgi:hypothetical protein